MDVSRGVQSGQQSHSAKVLSLVKAPRVLPLTRAQVPSALSLLSRPASGASNLVAALDIDCLDTSLIDQAARWLKATILKHPELRSEIDFENNVLVRREWSEVTWPIFTETLPAMTEEACSQYVQSRCQQPFGSAMAIESGCQASGPALLWRVHVFRRTESRAIVALVMHPSFFDQTSIWLLCNDLLSALNVSTTGHQAGRPTQPVISPSTEANAKSELIPRRSLYPKTEVIDFWQRYLNGAPPLHALPTQHARACLTDEPGAAYPIRFDPALVKKLHQWGVSIGIGVPTIMLSLWSAYLLMLGATQDMVLAVGLPQRAPGQPSTLGKSAIHLPFRLTVSSMPTPVDLAYSADASWNQVLAHQDITFQELIEILVPLRSAQHSPLAQLGFTWFRAQCMADCEGLFLPGCETSQSLPGCELRPWFLPSHLGQFELGLLLTGYVPGGGSSGPASVKSGSGQKNAGEAAATRFQPVMSGMLTYRRDLFSPEQIAVWAQGFQQFMASALAAPNSPLSLARDDALLLPCFGSPLPKLEQILSDAGDRQALSLTMALANDGPAYAARRAMLDQLLGGELSETIPMTQPRNHTEWMVASAFADVLGMTFVPLDVDFFELGGDSLQALQLVDAINQQFAVQWSLAEVMDQPTVERFAARLMTVSSAERHDAKPSSAVSRRQGSLWVLQRGAPGVRPLWLFHPLSGSSLVYANLVRRLDPRRPVLGFEADNSEVGSINLDRMVENYVEQIIFRQPTGPYLLGGWCLGGLLAYLAAQQLRRAGHLVETVLLMDTPPPAVWQRDHDSFIRWQSQLQRFAAELARPQGRHVNIADCLEADSAEQAVAQVWQRLRAARLLAVGVTVQLFQQQFRRFATYARAVAHYVQTEMSSLDSLPGNATGFEAFWIVAEDRDVDGSLSSLDQTDFSSTAWQPWVHRDDLLIRPCPGDHFAMLSPPRVELVADFIEDMLPVEDYAEWSL